MWFLRPFCLFSHQCQLPRFNELWQQNRNFLFEIVIYDTIEICSQVRVWNSCFHHGYFLWTDFALISSSKMTTHWHLWIIKWACHSCCQIKNYGLLTGGHLLLTKAFWVCHTFCQISNKELLTEAKFILLNSAHLLLFCLATDTTLTILYQLYYLGHGHLWVGGPVTFFVRL